MSDAPAPALLLLLLLLLLLMPYQRSEVVHNGATPAHTPAPRRSLRSHDTPDCLVRALALPSELCRVGTPKHNFIGPLA